MVKLKKLAKLHATLGRRALRSFDKGVQKALLWPLRRLWKVKRLRRTILPIARFVRHHHRVTAGGLATLMIAGVLIPVVAGLLNAQRYQLNDEVQQLIGAANENITSKIDYNPELAAYEFNADAKNSAQGSDPATQLAAQTGGGDKDAEQQYSVDVSRDLKDGVTYYENNLGLNFSLKPQFAAMSGQKVEGGRLLYPLADGLGGQLVYTAQSKGLKEDVVLHKKPAQDEVVLRYNLELPSSLDVKLLDNGDLGIYSADPALYGSIQYGSSDDEALVRKVREESDKTHLAFTVPAPYVVRLGDHGNPERMALSSRFVLSDDKQVLSVITTGFGQTGDADYPLSIDPSVTVTSTADFTDGGNDEDNNLTFGTDQISRDQVGGGALGSWATTTSLPVTGESRAVAYNGRIYATRHNGVAALSIYTTTINSDGTLGASWTSSPNQPLQDHGYRPEFVTHSGYVYLIGGQSAATKVEYSEIQADGSLGAWQSAGDMSAGRQDFGATAYNGRIYVAGSDYGDVGTNVVEFASINVDGSLTAWQTTTNLPAARSFNGLFGYNGYLFVIGGWTTVQGENLRTTINDDGTLNTWQGIGSVATGPYSDEGAVVQAGGYVYIVSGFEVGSTNGSGLINYGQITANGSISPWRPTTSLGTANRLETAGVVAYNGYLYRIGGKIHNVGMTSDVQYAPIKTAGDVDRWTTSSTVSFTRNNAATVAYNGYLYVLGGQSGTTGTVLATVTRTLLSADGTWGGWTVSTGTGSGSFGTATRSMAAFAYNGYMYALGGTNAGGTTYTTTVQRSPINSATGALGTWATASQPTLPVGRWGHKAAVYNGRVYVTGGRTGAAAVSNTTYYASISGGVIGAWSTSANTFTTARTQHEMVQYGGYLYIMGGWNGTTLNSDVQYTKVNDDGTLTTWASTEALYGGGSGAVHSFTAFAAGGYIYTMGGAKSSGVSNITAKSQINTDGTLNVWQQVSDPSGTTIDRSYHTAAYYDGYVYVINGIPASGGTGVTTITWGRLTNGGSGTTVGTWQASQSLPTNVGEHGAVARNGYVYVIGGTDGANTTSQVYYAAINANGGSLGSWQATSAMGTARADAGVFMSGNYLYATGGDIGTASHVRTTEYALFNTDGTLGAWQTTTSLPVNRSGHVAGAHGGYAYALAGLQYTDTGTVPTTATTSYYAPINSDGTIGAWSTSTAVPASAAASNPAGTVYGDYVYITSGGVEGIWYAQLNSDGTIGTWKMTSGYGAFSLPLKWSQLVGHNGYMYVLGGEDSGNTNRSFVMYTAINANGSLDTWSDASSLGAVVNDHAAVAYAGYLYSSGGYGLPTNSVQMIPLDVQARRATYSKMMHVGYFGAITGLSTTGTLAGGATVETSYRVASANGQFGGAYDGTDVVSLNDLADLCTTATGAARAGQYVQVTVTIDDSQSSRYAEAEAANASVLGSATVDYAPPVRAPNELRMRHGKWFSGGLLQELDTCLPLAIDVPAEYTGPEYVGFTSAQNSSGNIDSITGSLPVGALGFVATVYAGQGFDPASDIIPPSGWALVQSQGQTNGGGFSTVENTQHDRYIYVATSSTPGTTWLWANADIGYAALAIVGYDRAVQLHSAVHATGTVTAPSATASSGDKLVLRIAVDWSDDTTPVSYPTNATIGQNQVLLAALGAINIAVAHSQIETAGVVGSAAFTINAPWAPMASTLILEEI